MVVAEPRRGLSSPTTAITAATAAAKTLIHPIKSMNANGADFSHQAEVAVTTDDAAAISLLRRQLTLLLLIRCLRTAHLAQPILVPYYSSPRGVASGRSRGGCDLSPSSVLWLGSFYSALVTLAEMPSGLASDHLGRRTTLHLAFLGLGTSLLVTSLASTLGEQRHHGSSSRMMWAALGTAQLLRAIGSSLFSGTDMALLYETLRKHHGPSVLGKSIADEKVLDIESRHVFFTTATEAAFAALGGLAGEKWGLRNTVAASSVPFLAGAGACLFLENDWRGKGSRSNGGVEGASAARTGAQSAPESVVIVGRKSSNLTLPGVAGGHSLMPGKSEPQQPKGEKGGSSPSLSLLSTSRSTSSNPSAPTQQPSRLSLLLHVPPRIRTIFLVGVVLNCGTYVASTALNPLLWSSAGIPTLHFGWIGAANGAASAVAALTAPRLRRALTKGKGGGGGPAVKRGDGGSGGYASADGTEGLLLLLLAASAAAYGMMAMSAYLSSSSLLAESLSSQNFRAVSVILAVGASIALSLVRGLAWPVLGSAINASVNDNGSRATTLSAFAGAVKVGMVGTGFGLGLVLGEKPQSEVGVVEGSSLAVPGLFKGCALCGLTLASVGLWLGGAGLASNGTVREGEAVGDKHKAA